MLAYLGEYWKIRIQGLTFWLFWSIIIGCTLQINSKLPNGQKESTS